MIEFVWATGNERWAIISYSQLIESIGNQDPVNLWDRCYDRPEQITSEFLNIIYVDIGYFSYWSQDNHLISILFSFS